MDMRLVHGACGYCSSASQAVFHQGACPRVKSIETGNDGTTRVEFHPEPSSFPKVRGKCPQGCGETLFLGSGGYVTCSLIGCPKPDSVSDMLLRKGSWAHEDDAS